MTCKNTGKCVCLKWSVHFSELFFMFCEVSCLPVKWIDGVLDGYFLLMVAWALLQVKCNCKNGLVLFKRERWVLLELKMGFWSILGHCMRKFKKWCRNMEEVNKLSSGFEASKAGFWKWIRNSLSCALYLFDKRLFWCLCIWRLVLQIPYVKNISCSLLGRVGGPYLQRTAWRK